MHKIKKAAEYPIIFLTGGVGYIICELLWRGYSHTSMFFAGGICLSALYASEKKFFSLPLTWRCIFGSVLITSVEFIFGCIFNILLGLSVWDYSALPFNIMGQVCLRFSLLWGFLCAGLSYLCKALSKIFSDKAAHREFPL